MRDIQAKTMVKLARRAAKAYGFSLSDEAADALSEWVDALVTLDLLMTAIPERVRELIGAMARHGLHSTPLGTHEFETALAELGPDETFDIPRRRVGRVAWASPAKGYGFILPEDDENLIVVHHVEMEGDFDVLSTGNRVEFDLVRGDRGRVARNVTRLGGELWGLPALDEAMDELAMPHAADSARRPQQRRRAQKKTRHRTGELPAAAAPGGFGFAMPDDPGVTDLADGPPGTGKDPASGANHGESRPEPVIPVRQGEPPSSVYALLEAPDTVVAETEFTAVAGLSGTQSPGVFGDALDLPEATNYPYVLSLQLVAEGFELAQGDSWRREIVATADAPYPTTQFLLRALLQAEPVRPRALQAIYSIGGQAIGFAVRPVAVIRTAADRPAAPPPPQPPAADIRVPTERVPADLTITIIRDSTVHSLLLWTVESPHPGVRMVSPDGQAVSSDIGYRPEEFAKQVVQKVNLGEGKSSLKLQMRGLARKIGGKIPEPVWNAIRAASLAANGPPSILILSQEPYVPWELALVNPRLDSEAPEFLGAQANLGRWVLGPPTPPLPPPDALCIATMAVVWGVYSSSKWARLEAAEEEAAALRETYGAESVDASLDPVLKCLVGTPAADALHFAIHGVYSPGGLQDGLVLTDGETINPDQVSGGELSKRPFVFLNACQVGSAQEVLGDYAGMASAFLDANASAVIAPLWSVKDTAAKEISMSFYQAAFAGEPVAAVLRRQRAGYGRDNSATCLAYQYFGHPELRISRPN
jgi:cold shock CspA family protein